MEVPKRILTKTKVKFKEIGLVLGNPPKNARNETHANSGAKVECLCAKKSNVN